MSRLVYCPGVCRECGCSDEQPCEGGCMWVEDDLCSACADLSLDLDEDLDVDDDLVEGP